MKILIYTTIIILFLTSCSKSDDNGPNEPINELEGPIGKPVSGFGSDGTNTITITTFESPTYPGKNVEIFHPQGLTTAKPTIFFSHPYGGEESINYSGLLEFIAKKGYVVVFAPYPTSGVSIDDRYNTLWQSFKSAATNFPNLIDTQKVGFMGHSFGGGASFSLAYRAFVDENWGVDGRFIYTTAQWYSYQLTNAQLQSFPANTKLIVQIFDDDTTNDHRMAIDIFKNINIPNSEKDFISIKESFLANYTYTAGHDLPNTEVAFDAYDYYGIYRLLDALIDYSFNNNVIAKEIALGNGTLEQITMPSFNGQSLEPLEVTDNPVPMYPQDRYLFKCSAIANPRNGYCD